MELLRKWDCNVPTLRFSNKTIWEKKRIKDFCEVNPKTEELEDEFIYIDLESVSKGCLLSKNIISKTNAPSRAQRVLTNNDILFQCVRPYQMNNLLFNAENADFQYVASTGYAQIRTQENPSFVYHLLHSPNFNKEVMLRCTGSSYPAITSSDLGDIEVYICGVGEQQKIGHFLDLIDRRIAVQNKIIEDLKVLKKELCKVLLNNKEWPKFRIRDIANLGRGRVINTDEINSQKFPLYPVYSSQTSNNGIMGYLEQYDFEGEYITWTTDGANAGTVFYRNGRFNCTNVCGTLKLTVDFDYYITALSIQMVTEKYVSKNLANPKLMNNVMAEIEIFMPDIRTQKNLSNLFLSLDKKIESAGKLLSCFVSEKKFLLIAMFI